MFEDYGVLRLDFLRYSDEESVWYQERSNMGGLLPYCTVICYLVDPGQDVQHAAV